MNVDDTKEGQLIFRGSTLSNKVIIIAGWYYSSFIKSHEFCQGFFKMIGFFLKDFIYLFLEMGREREREENINVWLPLMHPLLGT